MVLEMYSVFFELINGTGRTPSILGVDIADIGAVLLLNNFGSS